MAISSLERIDMAFANAEWRELHDQAMGFVEAAIGSDHNPLILNTSFPLGKVGKPFQVQVFLDYRCKSVISEAWEKQCEGSKMDTVCKKLRGCKENLKGWHCANFGELRLQIAAPKEQLLQVQSQLGQGYNPDLVVSERSLICKLEDLWQNNAMHWH